MSESTLNKTKNYFRCVGTVNETNLKMEQCDIKIKDKDGNDDGVIRGERIMGSVSVRCDDGIHTFRVFFQSHNAREDKNGNRENSRWKMATSMLEWNPEINGNGEPATMVNIEGTIGINDYLGQDGSVKSALQMNISKASTKVSEDEAKACSWSGTAFIKAINPETINDEETGRLVVDLLGVNGMSEVFPIKAYVEADLAEAFEDTYEVEETVPMDIDITVKHIGQKKTAKKAFGNSSKVNVNNGFDVTEYIIVGADDPIEEPDEEDDDGNVIDNGWLNPKAIKNALKERDTKLEGIKAGNGATEKKSSVKEAKKQMAKTKTKTVEAFDDEEDPF